MPKTPQEYYDEFSNDYCDTLYTWGARKLVWGKGAVYDMEGFAYFAKMLPYPCYGTYKSQITKASMPENIEDINSLPRQEQWRAKFGDFDNSGAGKLSLPYKFLEILDPDCFQEIQDTSYHSVANAVRNAADVSRACDIFFKAHEKNSSDALYEWESRGATETLYEFGQNSLIKCLISCGPNIMPTGYSHKRWTAGPNLECYPVLLGGFFECVCCPPGPPCPPRPKDCVPGGSCDAYPGLEQANIAAEPKPMWPTGDARPGEGFPSSSVSADGSFTYNNFIHAGYFLRKSYGGYGNFINKSSDKFYGSRDPSILIKYSQRQNGFLYSRLQDNPINENEKFYGTNTRLPANAKIPIQRIKSVTKVSTSAEVRDFLHNGYGIVLSTNVGFSNKRDSNGISYPDRLWYHTLAIIGCDDTKSLTCDSLFLLANSWGEWNGGGHPDWGPIPVGSFLITGTHLDCILQEEWPLVEKIFDCNQGDRGKCRPYTLDNVDVNVFPIFPSLVGVLDHIGQTGDGAIVRVDKTSNERWVRFGCNGEKVFYLSSRACDKAAREQACGDKCFTYSNCDFRQCGPNQKPWAIAFALSFEDNPPFRRKDMRYEQFYRAGSFGIQCSSMICISVIDEDSSNTNRNQHWRRFREKWPARKFFVLKPGSGTVTMPEGWNGTGPLSADGDWYATMNLASLLGSGGCSRTISLLIDESGSMTMETVRSSYDTFVNKLKTLHNISVERGNLIVMKSVSEEWILPHMSIGGCE